MIKLELGEQDVNIVLKGLGNMPVNEAFNTVHKILVQLEATKQTVSNKHVDDACAALAEDGYHNQ